MNDNDSNEVPLEVLAPSAVHALEKASIDVQVATAHQYPRSIEKFRKRALEMATLDEETAESCIYCRNVGKELDKATGRWVDKFAEGPSIRLAEIVGCSYGNLRVASRIIEQTPRYVKCEGVCHDLESNYAGKSEIMESTVNKEGQPYSERQRALIAKVAVAKAYRDAIFKVVPRALAKPILAAAKKVASGQGKPLEERRKRVQAWASGLKINEARIFAVLGVNGWSEVGEDHLMILTGLKNALDDGDRIDDVFPPLTTPEGTGKGPEMPGRKPEKGSQTRQKPPEGVSTPSAPEKSQEPAKAPQGEPKKEASAPSETAPEPAKAPEAAQTTPEPPDDIPFDDAKTEGKPEPAGAAAPAAPEPDLPDDPKLQPKPGETDALQSVKILGLRSKVTYNQIMAWAKANKLAKDGQALADLAETKLLKISQQWATILPAVRDMGR